MIGNHPSFRNTVGACGDVRNSKPLGRVSVYRKQDVDQVKFHYVHSVVFEEIKERICKKKILTKTVCDFNRYWYEARQKIPPNQQRTDGFKFVARNLGDSPAYFDLHNSTRLLVFHWKKLSDS